MSEPFFTDIESVKAPKGLSEDVIRFISAKKGEPDWLLDWRLEAYRRWLTMQEPKWANVHYPKIDFQELYYYSAPKSTEGPKSLAEVDPELFELLAGEPRLMPHLHLSVQSGDTLTLKRMKRRHDRDDVLRLCAALRARRAVRARSACPSRRARCAPCRARRRR